MQRLASGEWFTSRVSACGLFATAYPRCTPALKAELRAMYGQLCHDETPMVRRAAAQKLGPFAKAVERDYVSRELMPLFTDLTQDGGWGAWRRSPGLKRTPLPHCTPPMCHGPASTAAMWPLLVVRDRADQDSVRLLAVETCGAFAQALGREDAVATLLPIIHKFSQVCFAGLGATPAPTSAVPATRWWRV